MRFFEKVNKILDQHFIMEGQNEDRALAMLKKAGKESAYDSLLAITSDKNNKNKHLPILAKFFLEGQSIDIIKNYYERFVTNTKLNQKPIDNLTFQQFEQMVDSAVVSTNVKTKTLDDKSLYEDQNVKIYLGDTKEKCIKYGQGSKYGFCIARQDSSNLYWGYRSKGATFYFVYFKQKQENAPSDLIVIHAYPDEQYQINYSQPNKDFSKSKKDIVNEFPVLDGILGKVIVHKGHTQDEKKKMEVNNAGEIGDLKTLEDQLLFVELGNPIHYKTGEDDEWKVLKRKASEQNFNEVLKKYIEVGLYDIPDSVIKGSKYEQRYKKKLIQRAEAKKEGLPLMSLSALTSKLTTGEVTAYIKEHKDKYSKEAIDEMILNMVSSTNRYSVFIELYNFFHGEDRSKSSFAYNCVFNALSTSNIPVLNFLIDEKDCNVDNYPIPFYYLDSIIDRSSKYTDIDMIISHKALSEIIDGYAGYNIQFNDEVSDKKIKEIAKEIKNLGYKDLVPNFLGIFDQDESLSNPVKVEGIGFQSRVNRILDQYFILEGQNEDRALAMLKKAGKESAYDSLLAITSDKNNKNKHLPILVKFFLEGEPIENIRNDYERFISNTKINQKPIDNLTFQQFKELIDNTASAPNIKSKSISDNAVYEDENVKILWGDTKDKCIKYGKGSKYGFCISRSDSSNLYWGYRSSGATFYFVNFKNKISQAKAPTDLIVIHAYPNDQYQINYSEPNADFNKSKEEIIEEFPVLNGLLGKVITYKKPSEEDNKMFELKNITSILKVKTLDEKLTWIEFGNKIYEGNQQYKDIHDTDDNVDQWDELKKTNGFDEIVKKYIEVGRYDLPIKISKDPKFNKRYWNKIEQRLSGKIKHFNYDFYDIDEIMDGYSITPDEKIKYYEIRDGGYWNNAKQSLRKQDKEKIIIYFLDNGNGNDDYVLSIIKDQFDEFDESFKKEMLEHACKHSVWKIANFYGENGYLDFIVDCLLHEFSDSLFSHLMTCDHLGVEDNPSRAIFVGILDRFKEMGYNGIDYVQKLRKYLPRYRDNYEEIDIEKISSLIYLLKKLDYGYPEKEFNKLQDTVLKNEN